MTRFPASCKFRAFQRHANIIPLNVFHKTTTDTHIGDHPIPAGTLVIGQVSSIRYSRIFPNFQIHQVHITDPVYSNPEEFRPERFLLKDMKTPNKVCCRNGWLQEYLDQIPFFLELSENFFPRSLGMLRIAWERASNIPSVWMKYFRKPSTNFVRSRSEKDNVPGKDWPRWSSSSDLPDSCRGKCN